MITGTTCAHANWVYSFLLTFAYTEALEIKKDFAEVHATYEKFLEVLRAGVEIPDQQNGDTTVPPAPPAAPPTTSNYPMNDPSSQASFSSNSSDDRPKQQTTEQQKRRTEYGLVWIMYMRFAMRSEGVKPSRAIFAKARKDKRTPWEVYEAAGGFLYSTFI